jgi:hypothetical protein
MISIEPFVYFNKVIIEDVNKVREFFIKLQKKAQKNEGFFGLEFSDISVKIFYRRLISSFDISIDIENDKMMTEEASKIVNAEIILNLENETLIIWGRPNIIKYLNTYFQGEKYFSIINRQVDFQTFFNCFNKSTTVIREVSFKDIKVLDKYISVATLSTANSNDALYLIKNLGAKVAKIKLLYMARSNDSIEIDLNLEEAEIKLNINSINKIFIEELKELINNLEIFGV